MSDRTIHAVAESQGLQARLTKQGGRVWLSFPLPLPNHLAGRWREARLVEGGVVGAVSKGQQAAHVWSYGWLGFGSEPSAQAAIPKETGEHRARGQAAAGVLADASGVVDALEYIPGRFELIEGDRGFEALGVLPPELEKVCRKWWLWRPVQVRVVCPETAPGVVTFMAEVSLLRGAKQKVVNIGG